MDRPGKLIPEDEIDLHAFGRKAYSLIAFPFILLLRHIFVTLAFVIAAVLLCVALKYMMPRTYKSSFIIKPNDSKEHFHVRILGDLQVLMKFRDFKSLAAELKIPQPVAEKIASIQVYNPSLKNTPDSVNHSEITITTTDFNLFIPVQEAIMRYLENNPHFTKIRELQQEQVRLHLEQVNRDLEQLDSLKKYQLKNNSMAQTLPNTPVLLNDLVNPTATYAMAIERMNRKTALIAQLYFPGNFQLVKGCITIKHHTFPPRILVMCSYIVPIALVLCFIFLLYLHNRKTRINTPI